MLLINQKFTETKYWKKTIINDVAKSNENKKIGILIWQQDQDKIIEQIKWLISKSVDVIISEILPDEIPEKTLIKEYSYIKTRCHFVPPIFEKDLSFNSKTNDEILFITDNDLPKISKNYKINKLVKYLDKIKEFKILKTSCDIDKIKKSIKNAKIVIINTFDPVICHYIEITRRDLNLHTKYVNNRKPGSPFRYLSSNINYHNESYISQEMSTRKIIEYFIDDHSCKRNKVNAIEHLTYTNLSLFDTKQLTYQCRYYKYLTQNIFRTENITNIGMSQSLRFQVYKNKFGNKYDTDTENINRFEFVTIANFIKTHHDFSNKKGYFKDAEKNFYNEIVYVLAFKSIHWTLEKWLIDTLCTFPDFAIFISNILYDHNINIKIADTYAGELGFMLFCISRNSSINENTKKILKRDAIRCFSVSKEINCRIYSECLDFIIFLESYPVSIDLKYKQLFANKSKSPLVLVLSKLIPFYLNFEQILKFMLSYNINFESLCDGLYLSNGISFYEIYYMRNKDQKKIESFSSIHDFLTHNFPNHKNHESLLRSEVIVRGNSPLGSINLSENSKLMFCIILLNNGIEEQANEIYKYFHCKEMDTISKISLCYFFYSNGYLNHATSITSSLNESSLELEFNDDMDVLNLISFFISIFFKLRKNFDKSDEYLRISESSNPCHFYLIDDHIAK